MQPHFSDSKTFADPIPLEDPVLTGRKISLVERQNEAFDMETFVRRYFRMPGHIAS